MKRFITVSLGLLLVLSSCNVRKKVVSEKNADGQSMPSAFLVQKIATARDATRNQPGLRQAALFDVPVPLEARLCESTSDKNDRTVFVYEIMQTLQDVLYFFEIQMERFGWQNVDKVCSGCACVIFEKPDKRCVLVITEALPRKKIIQFTLFIFYKRL